MLKQLSRFERTSKYIIVGFVLLMALSLVVFYAAPSRSNRISEPARSTEVVAKVGSDSITVGDLAQIKQNYDQMTGGRFSIEQLGGYRRFLDGMIRDRVIAQEATRLGLAASDGEVADRIRKQWVDASGQFIGMERYRQSVTSRFGDIEKYEKSVRDAIAQEKLRAFITSSVNVSNDEVQEDYKRTNTEFDLNYVVVSADKLAEKIQPGDDELRSYYEQHKTDYRYLEPQKKITYVYISNEKVGEKIPIPDPELRQRYDALDPKFKQAGVKVQQIFLKVARKDLDASVEAKAKELADKARAGSPDKAEQRFADLAKGNSEDPATAQNGGWLARVVKQNPNKVDALYDRTVDMQPGDITDPIRYGGNWYILRRGESVPKSFEEAKPELLVSARNSKSFAAASKLAEKAHQRLLDTHDPQKVAQELAAEANMKPADMVKETPYIKPGDDVPEIGANQQFEQSLVTLNNPKDVGPQTGVKGGFAIPMLVDKKDPRIPDFDEVKSRIADAVKQQRAKDQLESTAKEIAAATSPDQIKAAAEKAGLAFETEEGFKLGRTLGKAGSSSAIDEAVYPMKEGEVTRTPVKAGSNWVVISVKTRREADLAEFAKQREQLTQTMVSDRQSQVFSDYIGAVQDRMKTDGKIKIYDEVLTMLEESEPAAAPQLPPQFPQQLPQGRLPVSTK
jgi:peptidyl-prolyl cis-trans isomerase D